MGRILLFQSTNKQSNLFVGVLFIGVLGYFVCTSSCAQQQRLAKITYSTKNTLIEGNVRFPWTGQVLDDKGAPINGALVQVIYDVCHPGLLSIKNSITKQTTTVDGRYAVAVDSDLTPCKITVTVTASGFQTYRSDLDEMGAPRNNFFQNNAKIVLQPADSTSTRLLTALTWNFSFKKWETPQGSEPIKQLLTYNVVQAEPPPNITERRLPQIFTDWTTELLKNAFPDKKFNPPAPLDWKPSGFSLVNGENEPTYALIDQQGKTPLAVHIKNARALSKSKRQKFSTSNVVALEAVEPFDDNPDVFEKAVMSFKTGISWPAKKKNFVTNGYRYEVQSNSDSFSTILWSSKDAVMVYLFCGKKICPSYNRFIRLVTQTVSAIKNSDPYIKHSLKELGSKGE